MDGLQEKILLKWMMTGDTPFMETPKCSSAYVSFCFFKLQIPIRNGRLWYLSPPFSDPEVPMAISGSEKKLEIATIRKSPVW